MLVVRVLPPSGNPNNLFPYQGIWGLEPVWVCGKIGCTYDERASGKPPKVKSVQCRLVRVEAIRGKTTRERLAQATIWTPPDGQEACEVGQVEIPFEMPIPDDVVGMSSMTMFPTARVSYQVEASATLANGRNVTAENRTMHVVRFNKMSMDPSSTGPIRWSSETNFDQVVPFEYSIRIPNVLLTPEEYIPVYISMSVPKDATAPVHFKGYELSTKRQVYLMSNGQPSGPIETTSFQYESEILAARTERPSTRSRAAAARRAAALAAEPPPVKMQIETDPPGIPLFDKDSFPMVLQPGESRIGMARLRMRERGFHAWSYGETGQNAVFRIQFFLAFKFFIKKGRSTESVKFKWRPITLCPAEDFPAQPRPLLVQSPSRESLGSYEEFEPTWPDVVPVKRPNGERSAFDATSYSTAGRSYREGKEPEYSYRSRRGAEASEASGAPARSKPRREPPNSLATRKHARGRRLETTPIDEIETTSRPPSPGPSVAPSSMYSSQYAASQVSAQYPSKFIRATQRQQAQSIISGAPSTFGSSSGTSVSNVSMMSYGTGSSSSGQSGVDPRRPRRLYRSASLTALAGMSMSTFATESSSGLSSLDAMPDLRIEEETQAAQIDEMPEADREQETLATVDGVTPRSHLASLAPLDPLVTAPVSPLDPTSSLPALGKLEEPVFRDPFAGILTPHGTLIKSSIPSPPVASSLPPMTKKEIKEAQKRRLELAAALALVQPGHIEKHASFGGVGGGDAPLAPATTSSSPTLAEPLPASAVATPPVAPSLASVSVRRMSMAQQSVRTSSMERRDSDSPSASFTSTRKSSVGTLLASIFSRRSSCKTA